MCTKLLQTYACGHSKAICTTPCSHALKNTQLPPHIDTDQSVIPRSNSTASSPDPPMQEEPSTSFSRPQTQSPLRVVNVLSTPTHTPAFHLVTAPPMSPAPFVSPVSPSFLSDEAYSTAASPSPVSHEPSPLPPTTAIKPEPEFCAYYIPRRLFTSRYPCRGCYAQPRWEELRERWVENYRLGHPLDKVEDVRKLSGVEETRERSG